MSLINKVNKVLLLLFFILTSLMVCIRRYKVGFECFDIDEFFLQFQLYQQVGYYASVASGTSILHNIFLSVFYKATENMSLTFLMLNTVSQLMIFLLGAKIILNEKLASSKVVFVFIYYFLLLMINDEQHALSRNDLFFSVFSMLLYLVIFSKSKFKLYITGFVLALLFSTRALTIILLPSLLVYFAISLEKKHLLLQVCKVVVPFVFTIGIFHSPSLIEHGKLSFYDKNEHISKSGFNWNDINTLATLRMFDEGKVELIRKNMYWGWNKAKVTKYKEKYNIKNSPSNVFQFIYEYPLYYIKLVGLNLFNVALYLFRRYSLFMLLPFVYMALSIFDKERRNSRANVVLIMFLTSLFSLVGVLFAVVEVRWLLSFEFLFYLSIILSFYELHKMDKYNVKLNYLILISSILMIGFNMKTFLSYV